MKQIRLLVHPQTKLRVRVELTPLGDKIKYRLHGKVFCSRLKRELIKSLTLYRDHWFWLNVFGTKDAINRFLKKNKKITRVIFANELGYDPCDSIR